MNPSTWYKRPSSWAVVAAVGAVERIPDINTRHRSLSKRPKCLFSTILWIVASICWFGCESDHSIHAYGMSQKFVKDRLRSPSTASFPWQAKKVNTLEPGHYTVISYVDSQNAFGGVMRTDYICIVKTTDGTNWKLVDLMMMQR